MCLQEIYTELPAYNFTLGPLTSSSNGSLMYVLGEIFFQLWSTQNLGFCLAPPVAGVQMSLVYNGSPIASSKACGSQLPQNCYLPVLTPRQSQGTTAKQD